MKLLAFCLLPLAIGLLFSSCQLRGKPKLATPAAPQSADSGVAAARAAAAAELPMSTPQTEVQLPAPQPISPEALASAQEPEPVEPAEPAPRPKPRATIPLPPRVDPAQAMPPVAPPTVEEARPRLQPIVPADESRRLQGEIQKRKTEIAGLVTRARARRLSADEQNSIERINSFMALCDEAAGRGDMRQADALCERALVLARELQNER